MKKSHLIFLLLLAFYFAGAQSPNFQWAKPLNGTSYAFGNSVVVDKYGNVYSTGVMEAGTVDMDPGPGTFTLNNPSSSPGFYVQKLDPNGNFIWATFAKGFCYSIAVDTACNPHITGVLRGTSDFDPGPGTFTLTTMAPSTNIYQDIFVLKLSAQGNFIWVKQLGQGNALGDNDAGYAIAVDVAGNVHVAGTVSDDIFIAKLDAGGATTWTRQVGGSAASAPYDVVFGMCLDSLGNVYTTGYFGVTTDFDPGPAAYTLTAGGLYDPYVLKLDASGNFVWARKLGGSATETGRSIAVDDAGDIVVIGDLIGTGDYDPGPGTYTLSAGGNYNFFVLKLNASGNFIWAKGIGTYGANVVAFAVKTAGDNDIFVSGCVTGIVDFDPSPVGAFSITPIGLSDVFILKLTGSGYFGWAKQVGGSGDDWTMSLDVGKNGGIYVTGKYEITCDFDPGPAFYNLTVTGNADPFVLKLLECSISQVPVTASSGAICTGASATLNVSGANSYTWNTGSTASTIIVSPTVTTVYTVQGTNPDGCVNSVTVTQSVFLCTGVGEVSRENRRHYIYPNPNAGSFVLWGMVPGSFTYEIINASGQIVSSGTKEIKDEEVHFSFAPEAEGLYVLRLNDGRRQWSIKFVVH
jgi:hypothetical protein